MLGSVAGSSSRCIARPCLITTTSSASPSSRSSIGFQPSHSLSHQPHRRHRRVGPLEPLITPELARCVRAHGIKGLEDFDASFELSIECEETLLEFLNNPDFHRQVMNECQLQGVQGLEFTGQIFQPVPWSPNTTKGMPKEFEMYHKHDDYTVINIPPLLMFKAKIFKPSRLCAIFKHVR